MLDAVEDALSIIEILLIANRPRWTPQPSSYAKGLAPRDMK